MPAPLLLDLTHTCHTRARTGIQRVARSLHASLGAAAVPITHDPHRDTWRPLADWEHANLATKTVTDKRSAQWPLRARLAGNAARLLGRPADPLPRNSGLLVPEVFSPAVAAALPAIFAATRGPRVAVFHDAIALQYPELSPPKTVARFPAYLRELLAFDGIAANSETSRDVLTDYWRWLGAVSPPPVTALPLGVDARCHPMDDIATPVPIATAVPTVLCVGTLEGRKNHLALLDACEQLWARGTRFELRLIGLANKDTGAAALARVQVLQAAGRSLRYDGPLGETAVDEAYAACAFTVYPSIVEGFGLPVIESLAHGKPCVCSGRGALGESARGGGCLPLDAVDSASLATAIQRLLSSPAEVTALTRAARQRKFRTWTDYARELAEWAHALPRRN
ncbi:MAG: glycosyltransferase family 4 protein [Verrucomicrobia bacterium]|nr:glycosyltransferase family 4 protein [Verrucomicrobiota bacterium]